MIRSRGIFAAIDLGAEEAQAVSAGGDGEDVVICVDVPLMRYPAEAEVLGDAAPLDFAESGAGGFVVPCDTLGNSTVEPLEDAEDRVQIAEDDRGLVRVKS